MTYVCRLERVRVASCLCGILFIIVLYYMSARCYRSVHISHNNYGLHKYIQSPALHLAAYMPFSMEIPWPIWQCTVHPSSKHHIIKSLRESHTKFYGLATHISIKHVHIHKYKYRDIYKYLRLLNKN